MLSPGGIYPSVVSGLGRNQDEGGCHERVKCVPKCTDFMEMTSRKIKKCPNCDDVRKWVILICSSAKNVTRETQMAYPPFFQNYSAFYAKIRVHHVRFPSGFCTCKKTPDVLKARGTLFCPKMARELTKSDGTRTIRSEIARGIVSNRSQGPELAIMMVFDAGVAPEYPGVPRGTPG